MQKKTEISISSGRYMNKALNCYLSNKENKIHVVTASNKTENNLRFESSLIEHLAQKDLKEKKNQGIFTNVLSYSIKVYSLKLLWGNRNSINPNNYKFYN